MLNGEELYWKAWVKSQVDEYMTKFLNQVQLYNYGNEFAKSYGGKIDAFADIYIDDGKYHIDITPDMYIADYQKLIKEKLQLIINSGYMLASTTVDFKDDIKLIAKNPAVTINEMINDYNSLKYMVGVWLK